MEKWMGNGNKQWANKLDLADLAQLGHLTNLLRGHLPLTIHTRSRMPLANDACMDPIPYGKCYFDVVFVYLAALVMAVAKYVKKDE